MNFNRSLLPKYCNSTHKFYFGLVCLVCCVFHFGCIREHFQPLMPAEEAETSQWPAGSKLTNSVLTCFPSVRPFAREDEFKATVDIVRTFQEGVGKELHHKLLQRAETKKNWVCNGVLSALFWSYRWWSSVMDVLLLWEFFFLFFSWKSGGWMLRILKSASPLSWMWTLAARRPTWSTAGPRKRELNCRGPVSAPGTHYSTGTWSARKTHFALFKWCVK